MILRGRTFSNILNTAGLFSSSLRTSVRSAATSKFSRPPIYDAGAIADMMQSRNRNPNTGKVTHAHSKRRKIELDSAWKEGSNEEVLAFEVEELLKKPRLVSTQADVSTATNGTLEAGNKATTNSSGSKDFHEVELEIEELSSTGDGLARSASGNHVYAIPFSVPGDVVLARVRKTPEHQSSSGDFVKVIRPSTKRQGVTPGCKYFSVCSGCQFQMLPYKAQLAHKKTIVEKAFRKFSDLPPEKIPAVEETGPSPLQYEYRTKLTPHFDGQWRLQNGFNAVPPIGFIKKGFRSVLDIESCPIGTPIVQEGFKLERANVATTLSKYKTGATLLIRESTKRVPNNGEDVKAISFNPSPKTPLPDLPAPSKSTYEPLPNAPQYTVNYPNLPYHDIKTYAADGRAMTTEYISSSSLQFTTPAGSFFQNNNSILPSFLTHFRSVALPLPSPNTQPKNTAPQPKHQLHYLLDAYCGSGLLSLSLAPLFLSVLGIEIDGSSIAAASQNAKLNNITNCGFIEADAPDLFADVPFPNSQTVLVIDPPRKGCSVGFLKQMLQWGPKRVVYVSCNVHSQARDVGWMCRGGEGLEKLVRDSGNRRGRDGKEGKEGRGWGGGEAKEGTGLGSDEGLWRYEIESLKGWDFFPQTGHVEGLCVLNRIEKEGSASRKEEGSETTATAKDAKQLKREGARSRSGSRSPKRQATSSSKEQLSIWEAVKDEVEVKSREEAEKQK